MDGNRRRCPRLPVSHAGYGDPVRCAADGARITNGALRERRESCRRVPARPVHPRNTDTARPHESAKLGQGISVSVQVRRLLLFDASADQPEVGHTESNRGPRQGLRHGPIARIRHLLVSHHQSPTLSPEGERYARHVHGTGPRRSFAQYDPWSRVGRLREQQDPIPRHGLEPDRTVANTQRTGGADFRRPWSRARFVRRRESVAAR